MSPVFRRESEGRSTSASVLMINSNGGFKCELYNNDLCSRKFSEI